MVAVSAGDIQEREKLEVCTIGLFYPEAAAVFLFLLGAGITLGKTQSYGSFHVHVSILRCSERRLREPLYGMVEESLNG